MKEYLASNFFSPPEYLRMPAVGIDISDKSLKYAELSRKNGKFFLSRFGTKIITEGIIESGQIKKKEKFLEFLKSVNEELKIKFINVSLPEEKAFISRIKIPAVKKEEIRGTVEFQLEEYIPLSPSDVIFDFEIINKEEKNEKEKYIYVNVIAFPKLLIEDLKNILIEANFIPLVFEIEAHAFARAIVPREEKGMYFLVDFGKTRTGFIIVSGNKVQFTSTIKIGGDDINTAIAKNLGISIFEAEEIKKNYGFIKNKKNEKIFNSILPLMAAIKEDIKRHIIYWNSHLDLKNGDRENEIKKILFCGGDSNLIGLPDYFSYELKIPAELGNPWINIISFEEYIPEIEFRESLIYAGAMGLALRSFNF